MEISDLHKLFEEQPLHVLLSLEDQELTHLPVGVRNFLMWLKESYYLFQRQTPTIINNFGQALAASGLPNSQVEQAVLLCLGMNNEFLSRHTIAIGGETSMTLSPKLVLAKITQQSADGIYMLHNHPVDGGVSRADLQFTYQLKRLLDLIQVRFIEHLVIERHLIHCILKGESFVPSKISTVHP